MAARSEKRNEILTPIVVLLLAGGLVAASWVIASRSANTDAYDIDENYFASTTYRMNTSTDSQIENLQSRLRLAPNDWQSYSLLGIAYLQKARESGDPSYYPKAEGVIQKALSFEPEDYASLSALGGLALARHNFAGALAYGEHARKINPNKTFAYGVIADGQIELGRYAEAVQTLQTMVDLRPDLNSYTRISYIRELYGDTQGALEMMQRAVDGGGSNPENKAWTRTQLATLYFNLGRLDQADIEYARSLELLPNYIYALAGLGRLRAAQGRTDEAIALLSQAIQIMPLPDFVITLGDVYSSTGNSDMARKQYDLVRVIQKLYEANGVDLDSEIALFNADHDIDSARTVELARQSYARRPSIYAADVLAWALYKGGDYQNAQETMDEALRLGTQNALMYYHAGMIAFKLGHDELAIGYLDRAIKLNPQFSILYAKTAKELFDELSSSRSRTTNGY